MFIEKAKAATPSDHKLISAPGNGKATQPFNVDQQISISPMSRSKITNCPGTIAILTLINLTDYSMQSLDHSQLLQAH